ncbi:hypothetical protein OG874_00055 [Nocardia sp. NBC_00565]|uniref:hypothetical protein n=1 Tax=Nocardia sp. NBC_00565 TaxID=2975993 RepID=UPI002E7FBF00|nr:hypothetical protein [Nocardia sp. NBC_00565]WUC03646.1 hypothetical protein OG874_00055 [Nocardia sp. NBC_00565]
MSTSRLPDWAEFVIALLNTDPTSTGYGIAAHVKTLTDEDEVVAFLHGTMRNCPADSRSAEVAWELLWLIGAAELAVQP